jgi:hypothetical protein
MMSVSTIIATTQTEFHLKIHFLPACVFTFKCNRINFHFTRSIAPTERPFSMFLVVKKLWYIYDVVKISSHAVSNIGVMVEWIIRTDLEESGRDPGEFLWRRLLPHRTTKKFSLEVDVYV